MNIAVLPSSKRERSNYSLLHKPEKAGRKLTLLKRYTVFFKGDLTGLQINLERAANRIFYKFHNIINLNID
jgi:hypothetical protein